MPFFNLKNHPNTGMSEAWASSTHTIGKGYRSTIEKFLPEFIKIAQKSGNPSTPTRQIYVMPWDLRPIQVRRHLEHAEQALDLNLKLTLGRKFQSSKNWRKCFSRQAATRCSVIAATAPCLTPCNDAKILRLGSTISHIKNTLSEWCQ